MSKHQQIDRKRDQIRKSKRQQVEYSRLANEIRLMSKSMISEP